MKEGTKDVVRSSLGGIFDRQFRQLHGLPEVTTTKAATLRNVVPILELAQTFIVQTARHREVGDTIFVEYIDTEGSVRIALPPCVADCIARQRDALTTKVRKRSAKAEAARRKAQGIKPGFMKK